ncbi:MAG TPA: aminotransferase class V-fold PLP-dependent enzyme [Cellvibrio sp.]|nr:aminotransferase class V-fold PLP-dependent enzyme [Cellvibrio sp.]
MANGGITVTQSLAAASRKVEVELAEQAEYRALALGYKPFHTLNPALAVLNDGRRISYGTMGGEGQPQTQAALLTRYLYDGLALDESISRGRWLLGRTWGDNHHDLKMEQDLADPYSVNPSLLRPFAPPPRLLMGPGPITVDPRVLRAMSAQLIGQYDPAMTQCMNDTMALYRGVFKTNNQWTLLIDGTARAGIEAVLISLLESGDKILVPVFGRFGHLLCEIAERCGAEVHKIHKDWGEVFTPDEIEAAIKKIQPNRLQLF